MSEKGAQPTALKKRLLGPIFTVPWSVGTFFGDPLLEPDGVGARVCWSKMGGPQRAFRYFCSFVVFGGLLAAMFGRLTPQDPHFGAIFGQVGLFFPYFLLTVVDHICCCVLLLLLLLLVILLVMVLLFPVMFWPWAPLPLFLNRIP